MVEALENSKESGEDTLKIPEINWDMSDAPALEEAKPVEAEAEKDANFFGPNHEMQRRERALLDETFDVQDETFHHQRQALDEFGRVAERVFGRARGERICNTLYDVYAANNRGMQEHNGLVSDYLSAKYPNRFGGSEAVTKLPTAERRAKKADQISDDFEHNARRRGSIFMQGYEDVVREINHATEGNSGMIPRHLNEFSEAMADFERRFAQLEKDFMDAPTDANESALRGFVAEYTENLSQMRRGFLEDSYNFGQGVGREMEDLLGMIMHHKGHDLENRCRSMINLVNFKAGAAISNEEITEIKAANGISAADEEAREKRLEEQRKKLEELFL